MSEGRAPYELVKDQTEPNDIAQQMGLDWLRLIFRVFLDVCSDTGHGRIEITIRKSAVYRVDATRYYNNSQLE